MSRTTCVALLRGINVGGHTVKMDRLRDLFRELGFDRVRSFIQTGNVFFESDEPDKSIVRSRIEGHLRAALGYEVPVCLRTVDELDEVVRLDPFAGVTVTPDVRLAVTFLAEPIATDLPVPYLTPDGAYEVVSTTLTELFVVWHLQNGRPGNSYGHLEKMLRVPTTTRFWHTTSKILAAAQTH